MTRYGNACYDECKKWEGYNYYSCYGISVAKSTISKGSSDYCSPSCGKTYKGISCDDACETRGNKYYWCNVGESWDYCSLTSCPVIPPSGYKDCSKKFVGKTVGFEYLYYPGYWLAKGYANKDAALWKPSNHQDLFCLDEGYAWRVIGSNDAQSLYLQTTRPGYKNLYFMGFEYKMTGKARIDSNTGYWESFKLPENFDFRIMCKDFTCSSTDNCILLRVYDRSKVYTDSSKNIKTCKECGSVDWFYWRVHEFANSTLTCRSSSPIAMAKSNVIMFSFIILYRLIAPEFIYM